MSAFSSCSTSSQLTNCKVQILALSTEHMIKISNTKYVTLALDTIYGTPCVPTGKLDGEKAEFICFMRDADNRIVWAERSQVLK